MVYTATRLGSARSEDNTMIQKKYTLWATAGAISAITLVTGLALSSSPASAATPAAATPIPRADKRMAQSAGASIARVSPGSPAEKAGIKTGDVITMLDGVAISDPAAVVTAACALPASPFLACRTSSYQPSVTRSNRMRVSVENGLGYAG